MSRWIARLACAGLTLSALFAGTAAYAHPDFAWVEPRTGSPRAIRLDRTDVTPAAFYARYATDFGITSRDTMTEVGDRPGFMRSLHHQQYHDGVPVLGGEGILTLFANGNVRFFSGRLIGGLGSATSRVSAATAIQTARADTAARFQMTVASLVDAIPARSILAFVPTNTNFASSSYRLAQRVTVAFAIPNVSATVDVDANTGAVLSWKNARRSEWVPAVALADSLYDGMVSFNAEFETETLECRLRTPWLETLDADSTSTTFGATEIISTCDFLGFERFVSAHRGIDTALTYFDQTFARVGYDGMGTSLPIYVDFVDAQMGLGNAYFDPILQHVAIMPPDAVEGYGLTLDIMGHETAHAVVNTSVALDAPFPGLLYVGESGAIDESIADSFGSVIEGWADGTDNYLIGEDRPGGAGRSMEDPLIYGDPDAYDSPTWLAGAASVDPPHTLSGVGNKWFWLLAEGLSPGINELGFAYLVLGIGPELASWIVYGAITENLLTHAPEYLNYAMATRVSAALLCGEGSIAFNTVLDAWTAVNVPLSQTPLAHLPPTGSTGIDPWTAKLQFAPGIDETEWAVDVSTDPAFINNVLHPGIIDLSGSPPMVSAYINLAPSTTYYWRARWAGALSNNRACWRPTRNFTTGPKDANPVSPGRNEEVHPWELELKWSGPPGPGQRYEVQVYNGGSCSGTPEVEFTEAGVKRTVDLKVDSPHAWRVRAVSPTGNFYGAWSSCVTFETTMPKVEIVYPVQGSSQNPWTLLINWDEVKGARGYRFETTDEAKGFVPNATVVSEILPSTPTQKSLAVNAQHSERNAMQWFRVTPLGPYPWVEEGEPDKIWIHNDGSKTIPVSLEPTSIWDVDIPVIDYAGPVMFGWETVDAAVGYELEVHDLIAWQGSPNIYNSVRWTSMAFAGPMQDNSGGSGVASFTFFDEVSSPESGSAAYGYHYSIRAIGPDGRRSPLDPEYAERDGYYHEHPSWVHPGDGFYLIRPKPVEVDGTHLLYQANGKVMWNGGVNDRYVQLGAKGNSLWTPTGRFEYKLYSGDSCSSNEEIFHADQYENFGRYDYYGATASLRVRSLGVMADFYMNQPNDGWSDCYAFQIVDHDPQEPEIPNTPCDTYIVAGDIADQTHAVTMGTNQGQFNLYFDLINIPDILKVYYDGEVIFETLCASGQGLVTRELNGTDHFVTVEVTHFGCSTAGTEWSFAVGCPY